MGIMSAQRVITHVVESELLFVTISNQPIWFKQHFSGKSIVWNHVSSGDQVDQALKELIQEAHKIVFDVSQCPLQNRQPLIELLLPHQNKVKLVLPMYSFWDETIVGEIPHWQTAMRWQLTHIQHWASALPEVDIVFVRDILDWSADSLFVSLITQYWSDQLAHIPSGKCSVALKADLILMLLNECGAPTGGSVLLQGSEQTISTVFIKAISLYESMYRVKITTQPVSTKAGSLLPFECKVREVKTNLNQITNALVGILPTPTQLEQQNNLFLEQIHTIKSDPWFQTETAPAPSPPPPLAVTSTPIVTSQQREQLLLLNQVLPQVKPQPSPPTTPVLNEEEKEQQLKEDIKKIFTTQGKSLHQKKTVQKSKQRKVIKKKSRKRKMVFYLGLVFVSLGLLLAGLLGSLQLTQQLVRQELVMVARQVDESNNVTTETLQDGRLRWLLQVMKPQQQLLSAIFSLPVLDSSKTLLEASYQLQEGVRLQEVAREKAVLLYKIAVGQERADLSQRIQELQTTTEQQATLSQDFEYSTSQLPEVMTTPLASAAAKLFSSQNQHQQQILTDGLLTKLADILGVTKKRTYAVVLQNSQELRPTGGHLEAISLLTFSGGSLVDTKTYSSFQLDTMITESITPPLDLTNTLGESQWWPSDANWLADPTLSANQISVFLQSTLKQQPDGVIFINTAGLPQLLRTLGPLDIPDFNEVLTEKNIGERLEYHSEPPTQLNKDKPEYRQVLLQKLLQKLTTLPAQQVPSFFQTLLELLDQKQILITLTNPEEQRVFRQLGWMGDMTFPVCPANYVENGCLSDGLALVETNIGINRANAYIDRRQTHKAFLDTTGAHHERVLQYTNSAASAAWPKGDYLLYMRAYTPGKPTNVVVKVDDVVLAAKDISVREVGFGSEIGFLATIPIASEKTITLSYDIAASLSPTSTYIFYENRQPSLTAPLPPVEIGFPATWHVSDSVPQSNIGEHTTTFPDNNNAQVLRVVQFSPAQ